MKTKITRKQNLFGILNALVDKTFFVNALAEETPAENNPAPTINYEQLIAQARKEEKDKLYGQIEKLKAQVEVLTKQSNEALLAKGNAESKLAELQAKVDEGDSKVVTELKAKVEALQEENKKLKDSAPNVEEIRKGIEAEYEVKLYAKDKLAENKGKILSVFAEKVEGKSKEEIDEAIKKAIESSDEIRKELGVNDKKKDTKKDAKNDKDTNDGSTNPPAPNPSNEGDGGKYNLEEISKLDPRSKEYAEWRKSVGLK